VFDAQAPALSLQLTGFFNLEDGVFFGYDGADFGVCRRSGGLSTTLTLTLTAAATGAETATVTLNDIAFTPSLTAGTIAFNCDELAGAAYAGWNVYQNGDTCVFQSTTVGVKAGAYTFSSDGDAAGAFVVDQAGAEHAYDWAKQTAWNVDKLDNIGGGSRMKLDPAEGNTYQIEYQGMGFGATYFSVADHTTGEMRVVHIARHVEGATIPNIRNPTMKLGWVAASLGSTTDLTVTGTAAAGFVEGGLHTMRDPAGHAATKTGVGTAVTNILTLRNRAVASDGSINQHEIEPIFVSVANFLSGNNTGTIFVYLTPVVAGSPNCAYVNGGTGLAEVDFAGTAVTGGTLLLAVGTSKTDSSILELHELDVRMEPGDRIVVAFAASAGTAEVTAALSWQES
jgi:hypothetical protein